jgi:hypothetical protein
MGQGSGRLMRCRPPRLAEYVAALLLPPASREEVLGDLEERCTSPAGYCRDAIQTVPLVIASRIRRTSDPPLLLLEAMILLLSFLAGGWIGEGRLPGQRELWGFALPAGCVLLGLVLREVYAKPGVRSSFDPLKGPTLGIGIALAAWMMFRWTIPFRAMLYGSAFSWSFATATKLLFPPVTHRPQGANGPALWLKHSTGPVKMRHSWWVIAVVVWWIARIMLKQHR